MTDMTEHSPKPPAAAKDNAKTKSAGGGGISAKLIEAVEVSLDALLGSARMKVSELTGLGEGDVVTLDATLSTAVDLKLNGATIARGELVTVGDHFAVRLTEIAA